ncbi:MAG: family 20 glycosylhydrolase [Bacteroidales bacterium]|nr:family 20 glycosylhydrolase [Bacteroidales bacterium]
MKKLSTKIKIIIIIAAMSLFSCNNSKKIHQINIIPCPDRMSVWEGEFEFELNSETAILTEDGNAEMQKLGEYLAKIINNATDFNISVSDISEAKSIDNVMILSSNLSDNKLGDEGYKLQVDLTKITIQSNEPSGVFYGIQSLLQLLPNEVLDKKNEEQGIDWKIPCLRIYDKPQYSYRGMHLDVSRHFFPKEFIKKFIDLMAMYKMNVFHWHLTDDNGWRIEIKKYPELTDICAWRVDHEDQAWRNRELGKPGEKATYGGFYTQEDIKEIIEFAKERNIEIIPEIEMPGHSSEIFAAFPELSCRGKKMEVQTGSYWPNIDVLCAGNEKTFEFLENVLSEVAELFPSDYIHIGGDEVDKTRWKACKKCQKRIKDEGLQNEEELQSYFIKRIEKFLNSKNKKLIGWDEILDGGLAPEATVMSWRGLDGGIEAAQQGHDVIMTPTSHCYFDYYQADPNFQPKAIGGLTSLKKVYSFDPTPPVLNDEEQKHILGVQGNIWTEYISTLEHAEYMAFPRMIALAEVAWTPKKRQNWERFIKRLNNHFKRLEKLNVNYCEGSFEIDIKTITDTSGKVSACLESEIYKPEIHYTTDGSDPDVNSLLYSKTFDIDSTTNIKAGFFKDGKLVEKISEKTISIHKGLGKNLELKNKYSFKYKAQGENSLLDGVNGSLNHDDNCWQGFQGDDLIAVIDLKSSSVLSKISCSFLQIQRKWIFLPASVEYFISDDGKNFKSIGKIENDISPMKEMAFIEDFVIDLNEKIEAKYIKIIAKNIGNCPQKHSAAGNKAWIFADEIIIE